MLDYIVQRFLGDAVEGNLHIRRQLSLPLYLDINRDAFAAAGGFPKLAQQVFQARFQQGCRAQLQQQRAHLGQRAPAQAAQLLQQTPPFRRIFLPGIGQGFCHQAGGEERLGDGVV